jgi:hypothetical protein
MLPTDAGDPGSIGSIDGVRILKGGTGAGPAAASVVLFLPLLFLDHPLCRGDVGNGLILRELSQIDVYYPAHRNARQKQHRAAGQVPTIPQSLQCKQPANIDWASSSYV